MGARCATVRWHGNSHSRAQADTTTYNAAISACAKAGKWVRALQLLDGIANSRLEADTITYSAAISAYEKAGKWVHAVQQFDGMATAGPRIFSNFHIFPHVS